MLAGSMGEADVLSSAGTSAAIEDQLAHVIRSARAVAVVAEELLREFSAQGFSESTVNNQPLSHAIVLAPRLLSATQQQLDSLLAMMRTL